MTMRGGRFPRRAGREFARNLMWLLAVFGLLAAVSVLVAGVPPLGALAFVGFFVPVVAGIVTVLAHWGRAEEERLYTGGEGGRYTGSEGGYHPGGVYHAGYYGDGGGGDHGGGDFGGGGDGGGGF
jgi:hypothetical protein